MDGKGGDGVKGIKALSSPTQHAKYKNVGPTHNSSRGACLQCERMGLSIQFRRLRSRRLLLYFLAVLYILCGTKYKVFFVCNYIFISVGPNWVFLILLQQELCLSLAEQKSLNMGLTNLINFFIVVTNLFKLKNKLPIDFVFR